MVNPLKGEIAFDAGGQEYILRYSIDAICVLEEKAGRGIAALAEELSDPSRMSVTVTRQVLWAGLQEHHPEISIKDAGELIPQAGGMMKVIGFLSEGLARAFPVPESDANPPQAGSPKPNGTGPHSIEHGAASGGTKKRSGGARQEKSL